MDLFDIPVFSVLIYTLILRLIDLIERLITYINIQYAITKLFLPSKQLVVDKCLETELTRLFFKLIYLMLVLRIYWRNN